MAIDLLVFGPHPDDLEIGLGGTIARYPALNLRVGLCDLTTGELGSNGTPEERVAEGDAARAGAKTCGGRTGASARTLHIWTRPSPSSAGISRGPSPFRIGRIVIPITRPRASS